MPTRVIAIDWSGKLKRPEDFIWRAVAEEGALTELEDGLDRDGIADWLVQEASRDPQFVSGWTSPSAFPRASRGRNSDAGTPAACGKQLPVTGRNGS